MGKGIPGEPTKLAQGNNGGGGKAKKPKARKPRKPKPKATKPRKPKQKKTNAESKVGGSVKKKPGEKREDEWDGGYDESGKDEVWEGQNIHE